ncbi:hypothetical protein PINS_up001910 [Pythium insidiosum]|nr:hypothetical protein PINS_up001910 [Pythium insidiosum]
MRRWRISRRSPDAKSSAHRIECIERAESSVEQVERYLRILVNESRDGDNEQRQEMQKAVSTYKLQVSRLKSDLKLRSREISQSSFVGRIMERWRAFSST